jgi:ABC-type branched-subunit amino acid transport system substrate-binding protein
VFRTAINDEIAAKKIATEASKKYQRVAIIYDGDSKYSRSFKKAFQRYFKEEQGDIVNDQFKKDRCDISKNAGYQTDPRQCLQQAKKWKAQALILVPSATTARNVKRLIELNFNEAEALPLLGADTMYDPRFLSEEAKDMIVIVPWHRDSKPSDFEQKAKELFANERQEPFKINWETAMAYDATQALTKGLIEASEKCFWHHFRLWDKYAQSTCLREELKNVLSNPDFKADGALGENSVRFDFDNEQYGDRAEDDRIGVFVKVCEIENSKVNSQRKEFEFRRTNNELKCIDS